MDLSPPQKKPRLSVCIPCDSSSESSKAATSVSSPRSISSFIESMDQESNDIKLSCFDKVTSSIHGWTFNDEEVDRESILGASEEWTSSTNAAIYDAVQRIFKARLENMFCLACRKFVRVTKQKRVVAHQQSKKHRKLRRSKLMTNDEALAIITTVEAMASPSCTTFLW